MLQQLNQYLFQFKALTLPSFGTIKLVAQPARLDVVEHLIYAPAYQPHFSADDDVSDHQVEYFSAALQKDEADVEAYFINAGEILMQQAQKGPFNWSGIGTFEYNHHKLHFNPEEAHALAPVPARRVMREGAQHTVLVGDQIVISDPNAEAIVERSRLDYWVIAAWVLVVLAVLFITYYLYQRDFSTQASGLKSSAPSAQPAPTWQ